MLDRMCSLLLVSVTAESTDAECEMCDIGGLPNRGSWRAVEATFGTEIGTFAGGGWWWEEGELEELSASSRLVLLRF